MSSMSTSEGGEEPSHFRATIRLDLFAGTQQLLDNGSVVIPPVSIPDMYVRTLLGATPLGAPPWSLDVSDTLRFRRP